MPSSERPDLVASDICFRAGAELCFRATAQVQPLAHSTPPSPRPASLPNLPQPNARSRRRTGEEDAHAHGDH